MMIFIIIRIIQSLNNAKIILPPNKIHWPDKERLDRRYMDFLKAG